MPPDILLQPWFQQMDPATQQAMMQMVYGMGYGQMPVNPYYSVMPNIAYGFTPEMDKYGNTLPVDVGTLQQNVNLQQDRMRNVYDPGYSALAGPEAFAPGTFVPQEVPGTGKQTGASMMNYYLGMPLNTMEGFIANAMAQNIPASQAAAEFISAAQQNPELMASIQEPWYDEMNPSGEPTMRANFDIPRRFAQNLETQLFNDTPPEQQYSEAAQWYIDQGIPLPNEQYGQGNYDPARYLEPGAMERFLAADENLRTAREAEKAAAAETAPTTPASQTAATPEAAPTGGYWERRGMTPQRGGWADDLERLTQNPAAQLGSALNLQGSDTVSGWLDRNIGKKIEGIFDPSKRTVETTGRLGPSITGRPSGRTVEDREAARRPQTPEQEQKLLALGKEKGAQGRTLQAKKERFLARMALMNPDYIYEKNRMEGYQQRGRNPTQDALMQRMVNNYLMQGFGPRG